MFNRRYETEPLAPIVRDLSLALASIFALVATLAFALRSALN